MKRSSIHTQARPVSDPPRGRGRAAGAAGCSRAKPAWSAANTFPPGYSIAVAPILNFSGQFEVDPIQAEHLIYAAHEGRLQLALRSPGDNLNVPSRSVGVADVLGEVRRKPRPASNHAVAKASVEVLSGSAVEVKTF